MLGFRYKIGTCAYLIIAYNHITIIINLMFLSLVKPAFYWRYFLLSRKQAKP